MDNKSHVSAGRAVASVIISRYISSLFLLVVYAGLCLLVISILLSVAFSEWWALLLVIAIPVLALALLLYVLTRLISNKIAPRVMNKSDKAHTKEFINDVQRTYLTTAAIKKSPRTIGFAAVLSFISGGTKKAMQTVMSPIEDTRNLNSKFQELSKTFSDKRQD